MTHLVKSDPREVTNIHPERLYTVAMQQCGFNEVLSGVIFRDSVSLGALDTRRVLSLRACGFQIHVFPFTADLRVCWPFGLAASPVGYVGDEAEAVKLAVADAKAEMEAQAKVVAERRANAGAMADFKAKKRIARAAADGLAKAMEAEAAAKAVLDAASAKRAEAEKSAKARDIAAKEAEAAMAKPVSEPEPKKRGRPKKNGD